MPQKGKAPEAQDEALYIEYMPLSELLTRFADRNPKDHDIGKLNSSMQQFGYTAPPLINERTEKLAFGHGRLETLSVRKKGGEPPPLRVREEEGEWLVPVIRGLSFRDDREAEAYLMADNRLTEVGGWKWAETYDVLKDHAAWGTLDATGWDGDDVQRMGEDLGEIQGGWTSPDFQPLAMRSAFRRPGETLFETAPLSSLKDHPRNYKEHPADQLEHLVASLKKNGLYQNLVTARDGTVLLGHGMKKAGTLAGLKTVPIMRTDLSPGEPRALAILVGDNELDHLATVDDRAKSEVLKEVQESEGELLGTGYDHLMLANLAYVTRPANEMRDHQDAAHWAGMPDYDESAEVKEHSRIVVRFETEEDQVAFMKLTGYPPKFKAPSCWYPRKERDDSASLRFEG